MKSGNTTEQQYRTIADPAAPHEDASLPHEDVHQPLSHPISTSISPSAPIVVHPCPEHQAATPPPPLLQRHRRPWVLPWQDSQPLHTLLCHPPGVRCNSRRGGSLSTRRSATSSLPYRRAQRRRGAHAVCRLCFAGGRIPLAAPPPTDRLGEAAWSGCPQICTSLHSRANRRPANRPPRARWL